MNVKGGRRLVLGAAAVLLALSGAAQGQEEPIVIGQRKRYDPFHMERPELTLEFLVRYSKDNYKFKGGERTETEASNLLFQETISGSTSGYVLSPNVFTTNVSGAFGLSQNSTESNGDTADSNGTFYEFDITNVIMPASRAPLTVFARRSVDLLDVPFGATLENTQTEYGATWNIQSEKLPTVFTVRRIEQDQTTLQGDTEFSYAQNVFQWHTDWRMSKTQTMSWDYTYTTLDDDGSANTETFDSHDATITHEISFGKDSQHRLESSLNYYEESGDFPQNRTRVDEYLLLRHSDRFETYYTYRYNNNEYETSEFVEHRATANFRHRLFDSLTTTGTAGLGYYEQDSNATSHEQFADLRFDYTKKVPLGRLALGLGGGFNFQQNDARVDPIQIVNEPYTFDPIQPIVIRRRDINPASIVITDSNGIRTYARNIDYTQQDFPDRVEIRRINGGAILPNESVLIDYQIEPEPANDRDTYFFGFGGRYNIAEGPLSGLSVYARYLMQNQEVSSKSAFAFTPDDIQEYTFGAEYRFWKMILQAEHRIHDSTVSPYNETRLDAQYNDRIGLYTNLGLGASYFMTEYEDADESSQLLLHGNLEHRFSRQLYGRATVSWYQDESGSTQGDGEGWDEEVELRWNYRQTEIYGNVRHSIQDTGDQENSFIIFQMGIIRKF